MLLTIGMIVKNEERFLERCLTGLKPILENVDSELIIADTGSTDKTVEIAKQFTDNVIYFEWTNDFAAARNSTLERAQGLWYMFVDGDEIFVSCDNIIKFFNSGEYKKYNSASFNIRNLLGNGDHYADFSAPRLTKILTNTRFIGKIHETFNTYGAPFKHLADTAEHYGYLYDEENDLQEKFKRNSEALLQKYETEKTDMIYAQLYECFIGQDPEKANHFMEEGLEYCKSHNSIVLTVLYADKMSTAFSEARYEDALEISVQYFGMSKIIRPNELTTDAEILGLKACALYNMNRYFEAIEVFEKFFEIFKLVQKGKLNTYDMFLQTYTVATERNFIPLLGQFTRCCILSGRYNTAAEYLKKLPISKYSDNNDHVATLLGQEIEVIEHFEYDDISKYYKQLNDNGKHVLKALMRDRLYQNENKDIIISALTDISADDEALKAKINIYSKYFNDVELSKEEIYSFAEKYDINDNADIFYIAMDKGFDITPLFDAENFDMKLCVYIAYMSIYRFPNIVDSYSAYNISDGKRLHEVANFFEFCMKTVPIYRCPKKDVFIRLSIERLFDIYAEIGERYVREFGEKDDTPNNIKAAIIAQEIIASRNAKDYKKCFAKMKEAVQTYEGIAAVIEEYQRIVLSEYQAESNNKNADELKKLSVQVKRNIRTLISEGKRSLAQKLLDEYNSINPNDPDVDVLYSKLSYLD